MLVVLILGGFVVVYNRLELVDRGLAHPTFPYMRYSQNELNEMYPQYVNVDVATTRTPEETHRLFVDKLKEGDLDGAVECCIVKSERERLKKRFNEIKDEGRLQEMISDFDQELELNVFLGNSATYDYVVMIDGEKWGQLMSFVKQSDGVWLIESL